ncbi:hypothetical protein [Micromonospora chersina]|uniref:hypothetical protein n=1 Tax=Micromonospora chersina TaxID=47854 RepID=UPI00371612CE
MVPPRHPLLPRPRVTERLAGALIGIARAVGASGGVLGQPAVQGRRRTDVPM